MKLFRRSTARRRLALRARAAVAFGLVSLLLSVGLATLAYVLVRQSLVEDRESAAMRQAYTNARLVQVGLRDEDRDVTALLSSLQVGSGDALLRVDQQWFASSVSVDRAMLPTSLRDGVRDGRAGHQVIRGPAGPMLAVGVPVRSADAVYFEVIELGDIERSLDLLGSSLTIAGVVATLLGLVVGASVSGAVLRPLRRMADVARRIVGGDLDSRLHAEGDSDLAPLVDSFNEMLDEVRTRIEREARFASDVSHELRGPLAVLSSAVDVVKRRRDELPERAVEAVEHLDAQVRTFNQLVLDLLEISRFDAGVARLETRRIDLAAFLQHLLDERVADGPPARDPSTGGGGIGGRPTGAIGGEPSVPGGANGQVRLQLEGHPWVEADPRRLHQVIGNLLDNAEHYGGGAVAVVLEERDSVVRVAVEDAGPGVPVDERQRIFERFQRGARADDPGAPRGTGLGLALVAEHMRLHGGRAWVEDRPGGGSRFVVEMPVAS